MSTARDTEAASGSVPDPVEATEAALEALASAARDLAMTDDPVAMAEQILRWTGVFIPGAVGRLWVLADGGTGRLLLASVGLDRAADEQVLSSSEGLGGRSVDERRPIICLDVTEDPRFVKKDWARREGLVSYIALPLVHRDQAYGNLSVFVRERRTFSTFQVCVLEAFAAQAAAAIANTALYGESVSKSERLEGLQRVSAGIVSTLALEESLQVIVEEAAKLLKLDGAGLRLSDGERLVMAAKSGISNVIMATDSIEIGESLSGRVALENRPITVRDLQSSEALLPRHREAVREQRAQCWIGVPVRYQGRLVGVLQAVGRNARQFTDDDVALLSAFADHAAIAIENSRLYRSVREELEVRARAEDALREHQEHLEELVEQRTASLREAQARSIRQERLAALGQLTGSVSHELRTPLGTVRTSLDLISRCLEFGERPPPAAIERALRNVDRCTRIIVDLLGFARVPVLERRRVDVGAWLRDVLEEYTPPAEVEIDLDLPAGVDTLIDAERVRQAVVNVLDNAVQAMAADATDDAGSHKVVVRCRHEADGPVVEIADTGPGIPADVLPNIFEPLFSTKVVGIGLGLAIVRQIMEQHGGDATVESAPGRGTRVLLRLPAGAHA